MHYDPAEYNKSLEAMEKAVEVVESFRNEVERCCSHIGRSLVIVDKSGLVSIQGGGVLGFDADRAMIIDLSDNTVEIREYMGSLGMEHQLLTECDVPHTHQSRAGVDGVSRVTLSLTDVLPYFELVFSGGPGSYREKFREQYLAELERDMQR